MPTTWALPCVPFAGINAGFFAVPAIGSAVWIEFEQGDPDYPIWAGCFWGRRPRCRRSRSAAPPRLQQIVLQTHVQNTLHDQRHARARPAASCSRPRPAR